jgi:ATP-dependent DNA helicase RecQ
LPSECLLLFSRGDRAKQARFIEEKPDPEERRIAWDHLDRMVFFAENKSCRRKFLLGYFGENFEGECNGCDNCLSTRPAFDSTIAAQKFLSCIYRVKQKSGFSVPAREIIEILRGGTAGNSSVLAYAQLSTFGIGKELAAPEWAKVAAELARLELIVAGGGEGDCAELTSKGLDALKARREILFTLELPPGADEEEEGPLPGRKSKRSAGAIDCDETLFEALRVLRKRIADERSVPPYVIFSDFSLRQMSRSYPQSEHEFARISGVGEKKLMEFKEAFLGEIRQHLSGNPRLTFEDGPERPTTRRRLGGTIRESVTLFRNGRSIEDIATQRGITPGTVYGHLAAAIESGESLKIERLLSATAQREIDNAFATHGFGNLSGAVEALGGRYNHGQLRLYRAFVQRTESF